LDVGHTLYELGFAGAYSLTIVNFRWCKCAWSWIKWEFN